MFFNCISLPVIDKDCLLDLINLAIHLKLHQVNLQDEDVLMNRGSSLNHGTKILSDIIP